MIILIPFKPTSTGPDPAQAEFLKKILRKKFFQNIKSELPHNHRDVQQERSRAGAAAATIRGRCGKEAGVR